MKISSATLQVMKNYSTINSNLLVKAGNSLSTMSPNRNILANANVAETFPGEFAIYDLSQFLGIVSIFEDPDFTFGTSSVVLSSGKKAIEYFYASPDVIVSPTATMEAKVAEAAANPDVTFNLSAQTLNEVLKAANILQLTDISVVSSEGKVCIVVADPKNPSSNKFSIDVDGSGSDLSIVLQAENLKMISGDYTVSVTSSGLSKFANAKHNINYYIMASTKTKKKG
jgi:hypothetical protein